MTEVRTQHTDLNTEFEKIKFANEAIKPMTITRSQRQKDGTYKDVSKDYSEVNQRVKAFRMVHPLGTIETAIVSMVDGVVTMQSKVYTDNGQLLATGFAQEVQSSSNINKTSFIENCETSAVGRALGMCGFGIDTSICSAEELKNALAQQEVKEEPKKNGKTEQKAELTPIMQNQLEYLSKQSDKLIKKIISIEKIEKLEDLSSIRANYYIGKIQEAEGNKNERNTNSK